MLMPQLPCPIPSTAFEAPLASPLASITKHQLIQPRSESSMWTNRPYPHRPLVGPICPTRVIRRAGRAWPAIVMSSRGERWPRKFFTSGRGNLERHCQTRPHVAPQVSRFSRSDGAGPNIGGPHISPICMVRPAVSSKDDANDASHDCNVGNVEHERIIDPAA